ncbi:MAG TPA: ABC transporter ATP-binding protein [Gaiellaceae bacterium]|nr:ABC transporter ATP-binding protein [Gaiellaceae bacterium]
MIEVEQLRKVYPGGTEAVAGIQFEVGPGEVFGLLGPNGAGKSTTIGILTTTVRPTGGTARVAGFDVVREPLAARRISSVVFQESVVDRSLTGLRNLEIHASLWRVDPGSARRRIAELADSLGIAGLLDRPVGGYSGGERRRLEIARALVSSPSVLFLDEPTVGLDPRIRQELLELIGRLGAERELTILLTTHYLDEAERLAGRVAVMHAGRVVALDRPERLRRSLGRELLELKIRSDLGIALTVLRERGIAGDDAFALGSTLTIPLHELTARRAIAAVDELGLASSISTREPTLDDVYVRLTGDRLAAAA